MRLHKRIGCTNIERQFVIRRRLHKKMNRGIDRRLFQEPVRIFLLAWLAYQQELWWVEGKMREAISLKPVILDLEESIDQIHNFPLTMHMGQTEIDKTCILGQTQLCACL